MGEDVLWIVGNMLVPLAPVLFSVGALKALRRPIGVHAVLEDGILFFYAATVGIVFAFDLTRRLLLGRSTEPAGVAVGMSLAMLIALLGCGGYGVAVVGRGGARDSDGRPLDLGWLSTASWMLAAFSVISCLAVRAWLKLF